MEVERAHFANSEAMGNSDLFAERALDGQVNREEHSWRHQTHSSWSVKSVMPTCDQRQQSPPSKHQSCFPPGSRQFCLQKTYPVLFKAVVQERHGKLQKCFYKETAVL